MNLEMQDEHRRTVMELTSGERGEMPVLADSNAILDIVNDEPDWADSKVAELQPGGWWINPIYAGGNADFPVTDIWLSSR